VIWLRTLLFAVLVPGTVLGLVPWRLLAGGWGGQADVGAARYAGVPLLGAGVALMLWCFLDFARRGRGTPAPLDPPVRLVIAGPYRWVRNPMYVAGVLILLGQAAVWEAPALLAYLGAFWLTTHLFVVGYEERALAARFGAEYQRYREHVPRWIPRRPRAAPSGEPRR
jgi:protein-S-isoprenylcysteine O-methyltransferase Ste14